MPTIVLTNRRVAMHWAGYDLRVFRLCKFVDDELHLVNALRSGVPDIDRHAVFASIHELDVDLQSGDSWPRHLRANEASFMRLGQSAALTKAVAKSRVIVNATGADRLILFGANLAGLARATGVKRVLLDVCDSRSLRMQRQRAVGDRADGDGGPARRLFKRCNRGVGSAPRERYLDGSDRSRRSATPIPPRCAAWPAAAPTTCKPMPNAVNGGYLTPPTGRCVLPPAR